MSQESIYCLPDLLQICPLISAYRVFILQLFLEQKTLYEFSHTLHSIWGTAVITINCELCLKKSELYRPKFYGW